MAEDRNDGDARGVEIPAPRNLGEEPNLQRLGAWVISAELARAPGVLLFDALRARDRCLLQVVPLRSTHRREDRQRMSSSLRVIEAQTRELRDREPELKLAEHGVIDRDDGRRWVYWALPWNPVAARLDPRGGFVGSADELLIVAHDLLERLAQRDAQGLRDPLLSEHLVANDSKLGSTIVGIPLVVDPRWTDDDLPPPRLLDAEHGPNGPAPTALGDLYRLGLALEALGRDLGGLPQPLLELFRRFRGAGDGPEFGAPAEALEELEALDARGELGVRPQSLSAPRIAAAPTLLVPAVRGSTGTSPSLETTEDDLATPAGDPTVAMEPVSARPSDPGPARSARASGRESARTVRAFASTPPEQPSQTPSLPAADATVVGVRLPGPDFLARSAADAPPPRGPPASGPYDRVVPGPALPGGPSGPPPGSGWAGGPAPTAPGPGGAPPPEDAEIELSGRAKLLMALGLVAVGVLGVVGVEWLAPEDRVNPVRARANVLQTITAGDEVTLSVTPESAVIVSERDGQILGRGQVKVMVGHQPPIVILHAAGFAATRLVLPDRGDLRLEMARPSPNAECFVQLKPPPGVRLQTLEGDDVASKGVSIRDATVVRDATGQGAWLVRCPRSEQPRTVDLSPRPLPRRVNLSVEAPADTRVMVDGGAPSAAPLSATVRSGFVRVEAQSDAGVVRRWVPAFSDTKLSLPEPGPDDPPPSGEDEAEPDASEGAAAPDDDG